MKKIFSIVFITMICMNTYAQEETTETKNKVDNIFSLNFGAVSGEDLMSDLFTTNVRLDFTYLHYITDNVGVGASTGLVLANEDDSSDIKSDILNKFMTVAGAFRLYTDNDKFYIGGEAGYAFGLDEGGFYYSPLLGVKISSCSGVKVSYTNIKDTVVYSSINIGYEFTF
jgi:hypothetical protein